MSLKDFISNAASSANESIQKKIDDGTFNRMAAGVGKGIGKMAGGLVSLVGMAENAFGKLKDSVTGQPAEGQEIPVGQPMPATAPAETPETPASEAATAPMPETPVAPLAAAPATQPEPEADEDYQPGVTPLDEHLERLAREYELEDDEITLLGMARLSALTGLFFARCDGYCSPRENECVEDFKQLIYQNFYAVDSDALDHLFDDMDRILTIDEIVAMTHRLIDPMEAEDRAGVIEGVDHLIQEVIAAEPEPQNPDAPRSSAEQENYAIWWREFMA